MSTVLPFQVDSAGVASGAGVPSTTCIKLGTTYFLWDSLIDNTTIYTSTDLVTWSANTVPAPNRAYFFSGAAWVSGGRIYSIDNAGSSHKVASTSNGLDWSLTTSSGPGYALSVLQLGSTVFTMDASNSWARSSNNTSWTSYAPSGLPFYANGYSYYSANGFLWAAPLLNSKSVYKSSDGISWSQVTADWGLGFLSNGSVIVISNVAHYIGGTTAGAYSSLVYTTSDGATWSQKPANPSYPGRESPLLVYDAGNIYSLGGDRYIYLGDSFRQIWKLAAGGAPSVTSRSL